MRWFCLSLLMFGFIVAHAPGQDLRLTDQDLEQFEEGGSAEGAEREPREARESEPVSLNDAMARYDQLIDRIKAQLRQVRIELRELPLEAERARSRLDSLRTSEDELRRRAYERVVFRLPHPVYEDFEEAIEEALERQVIREGLVEEIEANERAVENLEQERAALTRDLEQALQLKEEAREEAIDSR